MVAPTSNQKLALDRINALANVERQVKRDAQIEAERMITERTAAARADTNAAMLIAYEDEDVRVAHIAKLGFGNTNRDAVYGRLQEARQARERDPEGAASRAFDLMFAGTTPADVPRAPTAAEMLDGQGRE